MRELCRFSIENGQIKFIEGEASFIAQLHKNGVPCWDGQNMIRVRPFDGAKFIEACLDHFIGTTVCNDEDELDRIRALYPSPTQRHSLTPPASVA